MNIGKIVSGGEQYLPFALSKLRYYASLGQFPFSHTIAVDDGATILLEARDRYNGRVMIWGGVAGIRHGDEGMVGLKQPVAGKKGFFIELMYVTTTGTVFSLLAPSGRTLREWYDGQYIFSAIVNGIRTEIGRVVCPVNPNNVYTERYVQEIASACTCSKVPGIIPLYTNSDPTNVISSYDVAWMEQKDGQWGIQRSSVTPPDTSEETETSYPLVWDLTYLLGGEIQVETQGTQPQDSYQEFHDSVNSWEKITYQYLGPGPVLENGVATSRYSKMVTWGSTPIGKTTKTTTASVPLVVATGSDVYAVYVSLYMGSSVENIEKDAPTDACATNTRSTSVDAGSRSLRFVSCASQTDDVVASGGYSVTSESSSSGVISNTAITGGVYFYSCILAPDTGGGACCLYVTETVNSYGYYAGDYSTKRLTLYEFGKENTSTLLFSTKQLNGSATVEVTFAIDPSYSLEFLDTYLFNAGNMPGFTHHGVSICVSAEDGTALIMTNKKASGTEPAVHTIMVARDMGDGAFLAGGVLYSAALNNRYEIIAYSTKATDESSPMLAKSLSALSFADYGTVVNPNIRK